MHAFYWLSLIASAVWVGLGYVGWAWINYCAHRVHGNDLDEENQRAKWHLFRHAPFWGPRLIIWHYRCMRGKGHLHFGLRFR